MSVKQLVRVQCDHYTAGLILTDNVCTHAAPILKWTVGKHREFLIAYFNGQRHHWLVVHQWESKS